MDWVAHDSSFSAVPAKILITFHGSERTKPLSLMFQANDWESLPKISPSNLTCKYFRMIIPLAPFPSPPFPRPLPPSVHGLIPWRGGWLILILSFLSGSLSWFYVVQSRVWHILLIWVYYSLYLFVKVYLSLFSYVNVPTCFMRKIPFVYDMTRERISSYFLCFSATLGCVPVYGLLTEECSQHFDHHHSVFVHLLCYWSSALPGKEVKWTLVWI